MLNYIHLTYVYKAFSFSRLNILYLSLLIDIEKSIAALEKQLHLLQSRVNFTSQEFPGAASNEVDITEAYDSDTERQWKGESADTQPGVTHRVIVNRFPLKKSVGYLKADPPLIVWCELFVTATEITWTIDKFSCIIFRKTPRECEKRESFATETRKAVFKTRERR